MISWYGKLPSREHNMKLFECQQVPARHKATHRISYERAHFCGNQILIVATKSYHASINCDRYYTTVILIFLSMFLLYFSMVKLKGKAGTASTFFHSYIIPFQKSLSVWTCMVPTVSWQSSALCPCGNDHCAGPDTGQGLLGERTENTRIGREVSMFLQEEEKMVSMRLLRWVQQHWEFTVKWLRVELDTMRCFGRVMMMNEGDFPSLAFLSLIILWGTLTHPHALHSISFTCNPHNPQPTASIHIHSITSLGGDQPCTPFLSLPFYFPGHTTFISHPSYLYNTLTYHILSGLLYQYLICLTLLLNTKQMSLKSFVTL